MKYSTAFKAKMVQKMLGGRSANSLSQEIGVNQPTLSKWLRGSELGEFLRRRGLHEEQLRQWEAAAVDLLRARKGPVKWAEAKRVKELERELRRKEKALAEAAGVYMASESTMYRLLHREGLLVHRGRTRPATHHRPPELVARTANRVWSWDITYPRAPVRGSFFYLYLIEDVYSRRIVGWEVLAEESADAAAKLMERTCKALAVDCERLHPHSDNGGPMKGSTMLATLQRLGVVASFSRPRLSDDNPYSEALFRTLKYRPGFPNRPFRDIQEARDWVSSFVRWYNTQHLHSALNFVTPGNRYNGRDKTILAARHRLYERAKKQHPQRWSRETRDWPPAPAAVLNPHQVISKEAA